MLAADVRLDAVARDGTGGGGQPLQVDCWWQTRQEQHRSSCCREGFGANPVATCTDITPIGPGGSRNCASLERARGREVDRGPLRNGPRRGALRVRLPTSLWIASVPPRSTATFAVAVNDRAIHDHTADPGPPEGRIFSGEKRSEIHVVPRVCREGFDGDRYRFDPFDSRHRALRARLPLAQGWRLTAPRVRVTVTNHARGAAQAEVALAVPQGWRATPPTQA